MRIFGCLVMLLFVGFFVVVGFGLSILNIILRMMGINRPPTSFRSTEKTKEESQRQQKRFADGQGEYVDFEEV